VSDEFGFSPGLIFGTRGASSVLNVILPLTGKLNSKGFITFWEKVTFKRGIGTSLGNKDSELG